MHTMREYYDVVMVPFGETLTDMERRGIYVDCGDYLAGLELRATADKEACVQVSTAERSCTWMEQHVP